MSDRAKVAALILINLHIVPPNYAPSNYFFLLITLPVMLGRHFKPPTDMIKAVASGLALLCMAAASWAVEAQPAPAKTVEPTDISLEELVKMEIPIVEGASKYKQKTTEAPASVTIITADEVKKYG